MPKRCVPFLIVSRTLHARIAPPVSAARVHTSCSARLAGKGRAASWISTNCASGFVAFKPLKTESWRRAPPSAVSITHAARQRCFPGRGERRRAVLRARDEHDLRQLRQARQRRERPGENGFAAQRQIGLANLPAHPRRRSRRADDGGKRAGNRVDDFHAEFSNAGLDQFFNRRERRVSQRKKRGEDDEKKRSQGDKETGSPLNYRKQYLPPLPVSPLPFSLLFLCASLRTLRLKNVFAFTP